MLLTHRIRRPSPPQVRSAVAGTIVEIDDRAMHTIRALPSYASEMMAAAVGKRIEKTVDLLTSYGNINLVHASLEQLEKDYAIVNDIVSRGIFKVN